MGGSSYILTRSYLLKACKFSVLIFEELSTLLCQIEACLSSRILNHRPQILQTLELLLLNIFLGRSTLRSSRWASSTNLRLPFQALELVTTNQASILETMVQRLSYLQSRPKKIFSRN
ncbi:hypothetical protein TNIN_52611 [Trichonephila inaurata madagascariensis]|uniref:Uncharacterized protein n=1 Tax=Trichonephila inaurata madagascariensis TaxID=2747483 RepID=A0A8X7C5E4_9ARAC|nr:hypothetical protein TNIN_52611 [Trichonephila inaurata madagascariensis]